MIYCITPESIASEWCQWELARAEALGKPVFPVLLQAKTQLPDQYAQVQFVDFSEGPTGDAVARLIGGLQNLSHEQKPTIHPHLQRYPSQTGTQEKKVKSKTMLKILRDPAFQAVFAVIGVLLAIAAIVISLNENSGTQSTPMPTPMTPRITAQQNMDIREGPATGFNRLAVLNTGDYLDILGISDDTRWYQVLLPDGNTGWVAAASSAGIVSGNVGTLPVVVPTQTSTNTPTLTSTPTQTSTPTPTPTNTPEPTASSTRTNTPTPTQTLTETASPTITLTPSDTPPQPTATDTHTPTHTPRATNTLLVGYPCDGEIVFTTGAALNQVHVSPVINSPLRTRVQQGSDIIILEKRVSNGAEWYQITYDNDAQQGWILAEYVIPSGNCPD